MTRIRHLRIASELFKIITEAFTFEEFLQEALPSIIILEVKMIDGLKEAKILFTISDGNAKNYIKDLNGLTPYFRTIIAKNLNLKRIPTLSFVYQKDQPLH